jgi:hypothetical protein
MVKLKELITQIEGALLDDATLAFLQASLRAYRFLAALIAAPESVILHTTNPHLSKSLHKRASAQPGFLTQGRFVGLTHAHLFALIRPPPVGQQSRNVTIRPGTAGSLTREAAFSSASPSQARCQC